MAVAQFKPRPQVPPPPQPPDPLYDVMTAAEVARYLRCTEKHVRNLAIKGIIPGKRFGNFWRFSRKTITSLL